MKYIDWSSVSWKETLPRVAADIALVHLSALAALGVGALWQIRESTASSGVDLLEQLQQSYLSTFLPLSIIFPISFLLQGFYTRSRSYAGRYKWLNLARGATIATLLFLFAAFLLSRTATLPRSSTLAFIVLVNATMVGARIAKSWFSGQSGGQGSGETTSRRAELQVSEPDRVLVVGGGGYIGSILCRSLLAQKKQVRLLDSFVYGDGAVSQVFGHPNMEVLAGDCRNIQTVVSAMKGVRSVIHLAAIVGDPACEQDREAALEINYAATRMMVEIAKGHGVRRFVFASSCSVYGETEELVDEKSKVGPISLYAQTKVDSERALLNARSASFHPVILRLATVFGNSYRPRFDLVVNLLTAKALRDGVITIYNGEQWRPFIHVADVARGFVHALDAPIDLVSGEVYNLGDSRLNYTLGGVAETIQRLVPRTTVEHVTNPDRRNYRVCFDKVRDELGFECRIDLEEGVRDLAQALTDGKITDYLDPAYHNQRFLKSTGPLTTQAEIDAQVMAAFAMALSNEARYAPIPAVQPR